MTYALTQAESLKVADEMGYSQTASWTDGGLYTTNQPSQKLLKLLQPYQMNSQAWREKIIGLTRANQ